jgi:hypothetical protein
MRKREAVPRGLSRGTASEDDAHIPRYVRRTSRNSNEGSGPVGQLLGYIFISLFFTTTIFASCPDVSAVKAAIKIKNDNNVTIRIQVPNGNIYSYFKGTDDFINNVKSFEYVEITVEGKFKEIKEGGNTYKDGSSPAIECYYHDSQENQFYLTMGSASVRLYNPSSWKETNYYKTTFTPETATPATCTASSANECPFKEIILPNGIFGDIQKFFDLHNNLGDGQ